MTDFSLPSPERAGAARDSSCNKRAPRPILQPRVEQDMELFDISSLVDIKTSRTKFRDSVKNGKEPSKRHMEHQVQVRKKGNNHHLLPQTFSDLMARDSSGCRTVSTAETLTTTSEISCCGSDLINTMMISPEHPEHFITPQRRTTEDISQAEDIRSLRECLAQASSLLEKNSFKSGRGGESAFSFKSLENDKGSTNNTNANLLEDFFARCDILNTDKKKDERELVLRNFGKKNSNRLPEPNTIHESQLESVFSDPEADQAVNAITTAPPICGKREEMREWAMEAYECMVAGKGSQQSIDTLLSSFNEQSARNASFDQCTTFETMQKDVNDFFSKLELDRLESTENLPRQASIQAEVARTSSTRLPHDHQHHLVSPSSSSKPCHSTLTRGVALLPNKASNPTTQEGYSILSSTPLKFPPIVGTRRYKNQISSANILSSSSHSTSKQSYSTVGINERSLEEQLSSLTEEQFRCVQYAMSQWHQSEFHGIDMTYEICLRFARNCPGTKKFNDKATWQLLKSFDMHFFNLDIRKVGKQLKKKCLFPVPGLRSSEGHNMFYMKASRITQMDAETEDIINNLVYVTQSMLQTSEHSCTEGISFIADMGGWDVENYSPHFFLHLVTMLQGQGMPIQIKMFLIINPPNWFELIWKNIKTAMPRSFRKKTHIVHDTELDRFLMKGWREFAPDDMREGMRDTEELVAGFIKERKKIERERVLVGKLGVF